MFSVTVELLANYIYSFMFVIISSFDTVVQ